MNVLFLNNRSIIYGGADAVFHRNFELLSEQEGIEAYKLSLDDIATYRDYKGLSFSQKLFRAVSYFFKARVLYKVWKFCKDQSINVVHGHLVFGGGLTISSLVGARLAGAKVVLTIHDYKLTCPVLSHLDAAGNLCEKCIYNGPLMAVKNRCYLKSSPSNKGISNSVILWLETVIINLFIELIVDTFIFVSEFSKRLHEKRYSFTKNKVFLLPNNGLGSISKHEQDKLNIKKYSIVYFGRFSEEKGVKELLTAMKHVPNESLLLVGELGETDLSDVPKNVTLAGYLAGRDLSKAIMSAKWSILNSRWYENNPMSIIESFNLGVPVLAANIGGIPELVFDGVTGILFNPFDLDDLIRSIRCAVSMEDNHYAHLKDSAIKFAAKFNEIEYANKLIEIYEKV